MVREAPAHRVQLDAFRCTELRCTTPIFIRAKCRDSDKLRATYQAGVLKLECHKCDAEVLSVAVAP